MELSNRKVDELVVRASEFTNRDKGARFASPSDNSMGESASEQTPVSSGTSPMVPMALFSKELSAEDSKVIARSAEGGGGDSQATHALRTGINMTPHTYVGFTAGKSGGFGNIPCKQSDSIPGVPRGVKPASQGQWTNLVQDTLGVAPFLAGIIESQYNDLYSSMLGANTQIADLRTKGSSGVTQRDPIRYGLIKQAISRVGDEVRERFSGASEFGLSVAEFDEAILQLEYERIQEHGMNVPGLGYSLSMMASIQNEPNRAREIYRTGGAGKTLLNRAHDVSTNRTHGVNIPAEAMTAALNEMNPNQLFVHTAPNMALMQTPVSANQLDVLLSIPKKVYESIGVQMSLIRDGRMKNVDLCREEHDKVVDILCQEATAYFDRDESKSDDQTMIERGAQYAEMVKLLDVTPLQIKVSFREGVVAVYDHAIAESFAEGISKSLDLKEGSKMGVGEGYPQIAGLAARMTRFNPALAKIIDTPLGDYILTKASASLGRSVDLKHDHIGRMAILCFNEVSSFPTLANERGFKSYQKYILWMGENHGRIKFPGKVEAESKLGERDWGFDGDDEEDSGEDDPANEYRNVNAKDRRREAFVAMAYSFYLSLGLADSGEDFDLLARKIVWGSCTEIGVNAKLIPGLVSSAVLVLKTSRQYHMRMMDLAKRASSGQDIGELHGAPDDSSSGGESGSESALPQRRRAGRGRGGGGGGGREEDSLDTDFEEIENDILEIIVRHQTARSIFDIERDVINYVDSSLPDYAERLCKEVYAIKPVSFRVKGKRSPKGALAEVKRQLIAFLAEVSAHVVITYSDDATKPGIQSDATIRARESFLKSKPEAVLNPLVETMGSTAAIVIVSLRKILKDFLSDVVGKFSLEQAERVIFSARMKAQGDRATKRSRFDEMSDKQQRKHVVSQRKKLTKMQANEGPARAVTSKLMKEDPSEWPNDSLPILVESSEESGSEGDEAAAKETKKKAARPKIDSDTEGEEEDDEGPAAGKKNKTKAEAPPNVGDRDAMKLNALYVSCWRKSGKLGSKLQKGGFNLDEAMMFASSSANIITLDKQNISAGGRCTALCTRLLTLRMGGLFASEETYLVTAISQPQFLPQAGFTTSGADVGVALLLESAFPARVRIARAVMMSRFDNMHTSNHTTGQGLSWYMEFAESRMGGRYHCGAPYEKSEDAFAVLYAYARGASYPEMLVFLLDIVSRGAEAVHSGRILDKIPAMAAIFTHANAGARLMRIMAPDIREPQMKKSVLDAASIVEKLYEDLHNRRFTIGGAAAFTMGERYDVEPIKSALAKQLTGAIAIMATTKGESLARMREAPSAKRFLQNNGILAYEMEALGDMYWKNYRRLISDRALGMTKKPTNRITED